MHTHHTKVIIGVFAFLTLTIGGLSYLKWSLPEASIVSIPQTQLASPSAAALEKLFFVESELREKGLDGPAEIIGELRIIHADDIENEKAEFEYFVTDATNARVYEIRPRGFVEQLESGSIIKIKGTVTSNTIEPAEASSGGSDIEVLSAPEALPALETRSVLVIPANFSDKTLSCSNANLEDTYFNKIPRYFEESTNNTVTFAGNVLPRTTIAYDSTNHAYGSWAAALNEYAASLGYNVNNYDHVSYVLPQNSSGYAGLGNMNGPQTWIYYCNYPGVIQHELGHNLNMHHAATPSAEYGDYSGRMGGGSMSPADWNAPHKEQMGWVPSANVLEANSGTYTLAPIDDPLTDLTHPRILKAYRPATSDYYYFSYRRAEGISSSLPAAYNNKINIHTYRGSGGVKTYFVRSLTVGETFTDNTIGLSVTYLENTSAGGRVSVNAVCAASQPEVSVTPTNVASVDAAPKTFQVSVTNPPASGCGEATFTLDVTAPSGWVVENSFGSQTIATGQTTVTNITVTPASDETDATYKIDFVATNEDVSLAGTGYGYYTLDSAVPSAPTNLSLSAKRKFNTLDWNAPGTDIASYNVYRNGVQIGSSDATTFQDRFLTSGTLEYTVTAIGTNGLESSESSSVSTGSTSSGGSDTTDTTDTTDGGGGSTKGGGNTKCTPWPSCRNN